MSRQYDNYGRDQYNIENVDTLNVVNHADRNISLDDWHPPCNHMQGRKEAIAELNIALADPKKAIACIVGLGGYGKSTLAAKLFAEWKGRKFWADLSQRSRDFREFATRAIAKLGQKSLEQVNNLPEVQLGYELAAVLQGRGFLVVLDNLESLLNGDGNLESVLWREFLENWANDGEGSKVLITTREEPILPKLRFSRHELSNGLEDAEGEAVLRDFGILGTESELAAVSQRVGGIPLSLMLIVGLLCNDYEEEPHVCFLPEDLFGIEGAHRLGRVTTEAVFRASFERLESRLQSLLMAVSVFAKPFDLTMAATMIADEEVTDRDLLLLKKRGFVLAESGCYRFQPQIQELVQRQAADLLELHRRAINFYLTLCEAKPTLDPRYDTLEDADPYLQIFHHYCELGEYESAFYVLRNDLNKVDTFLSLHGYYERLVNLYSLLVKSWRLDQLQKLEYTDALINLGNAYRSSGQYQKAIFYHQQSLQISQSIGNKLNELGSLGNLGLTYYFLGQYQESLSFHQQALQISRIIFDKNGEAKSLG
ncbi:MAG: tetratricopeptide repeat protein, partial [Pseudanabaena sp.]